MWMLLKCILLGESKGRNGHKGYLKNKRTEFFRGVKIPHILPQLYVLSRRMRQIAPICDTKEVGISRMSIVRVDRYRVMGFAPVPKECIYKQETRHVPAKYRL